MINITWIDIYCEEREYDSDEPTVRRLIFVSHSHHDLKKVREIRNYLETRGITRCCFSSKCLNDDDARLPELIREEIKARNFLYLCDSPNAKVSKYVPDEVALVESLDGKVKRRLTLRKNLNHNSTNWIACSNALPSSSTMRPRTRELPIEFGMH